MNINVIPLKSVNEVDFGSDRETVRKKFGKYKEFKKSRSASNTTDDFGFCHAFYNSSDKLDAVEIFVNNGNAIKISGNTIPSTISKLKEVMPDLTERETGYFVSRAFSSGVYCDGDKIKSILFGKKNYYNKINSIITRAFLIEKLNQISDILMESENSGSFDSRAKKVVDEIAGAIDKGSLKEVSTSSIKELSSELVPETMKAITKKGNRNKSTNEQAKKIMSKMKSLVTRVNSSKQYHMESESGSSNLFLYLGGFFLCCSMLAGLYLAPSIISDIQELWNKAMNREKSDYLDLKYIMERMGIKIGVIGFPFSLGIYCLVIHFTVKPLASKVINQYKEHNNQYKEHKKFSEEFDKKEKESNELFKKTGEEISKQANHIEKEINERKGWFLF